jgi:hypothetical protein
LENSSSALVWAALDAAGMPQALRPGAEMIDAHPLLIVVWALR